MKQKESSDTDICDSCKEKKFRNDINSTIYHNLYNAVIEDIAGYEQNDNITIQTLIVRIQDGKKLKLTALQAYENGPSCFEVEFI